MIALPPETLGRYLALFGAAVIAAGFLPVPFIDPTLPSPTWFEVSIGLLPLFPLTVLVIAQLTALRLPAAFAYILTAASVILGGLFTLFLAAFSGAGGTIIAAQGASLMIACTASVLMVSHCRINVVTAARIALLAPVLAGLWSLAMIPSAYKSATAISQGAPHCIAAHSIRKRELSSLINLRGFSFYTTSSGQRLGDTWYFHGLLLVETNQELEVYNWSPRLAAFQKLKNPRKMIISPLSACTVRADFLLELPMIYAEPVESK